MKKAKVALVSMLMLAGSGMYAQTNGIGGTVTDNTGEPIIGASVKVKGSSNMGTVTDIDGNFKLNVKPGETLIISYIGCKDQEVKAGENLKIVLQDNSEVLGEVVVTGYQVQRKADLTGSVSVVSTKDLKSSADTDPMRSLQGKVPGMTITTDGSPIGTGTVRIRGIGSFNSSQDPLFVIDGVPTTTALNSLNMNDIESMQVLKDAASASIYGSRAANGVIIITTKRGKKGSKLNVDFSTNLTAQFYKDGVWHLYFQYNPYGSQWENMTWGHSTSTDLMHWEFQGKAVEPDAWGTIFSGSAVVDHNNTAGFDDSTVVAMYTTAGENQTQSLAYSTDNGKTFIKYEGNPVITSNTPDFRDPHMFWNEDIKKWNMILAEGQHMNIYSSDDLKAWTLESQFGAEYGNHGGVWECPDLMKLRVRGTDKYKWMLICNINPGGPFGGSATQ